jgi:hypothetical protein
MARFAVHQHLALSENRETEGYGAWGKKHKIAAAILVQTTVNMPKLPPLRSGVRFRDPAGLCPNCLIHEHADPDIPIVLQARAESAKQS